MTARMTPEEKRLTLEAGQLAARAQVAEERIEAALRLCEGAEKRGSRFATVYAVDVRRALGGASA